MTSTAETSGAPSRAEDNKPDTEGDSDEEVFHDARFPAEEEAVSWTRISCREFALMSDTT